MYRVTDIALLTADDERILFGDDNNDAVLDRLRSWGIREIVLKRGANGSFNAGYLAARLTGSGPEDTAHNGSRLAALVVQHRGAIIPRNEKGPR